MRAKKIDKNQNLVVKELRELGFSVALTHTIGKGFPDFVVGYMGVNLLVELKSDGGRLTSDEEKFIQQFNGYVVVAFNTNDILHAFLLYTIRIGIFNSELSDKLRIMVNEVCSSKNTD